jgi:simple sugar transport system ATP-binding protein
MVGRDIDERIPPSPVEPGDVVLEVSRPRAHKKDGAIPEREVSLVVHRGEIVGVAGVDGNGQGEMIEAILGLRAATDGTICLNGLDVTEQNTATRLRMGMAAIPADRHASAVIEDFSLADNALLGHTDVTRKALGGWMDPAEGARLARRIVADYDVKAGSVESPLRTLSGGHQQRFVLGRTLERPFDLLIAAQPTRGLDFGSASFVRMKLAGLREQGKAVLLVSMDLDEILMLSDRVLVMQRGCITGSFSPPFDRGAMGLLMAGGASAIAA